MLSTFRSPFLSKISERISDLISSCENSGWVEGTYQEYRYCIKAYEKPSELGLIGSEISKFELWEDDVLLVRYDRGWDLRPNTIALKEIINAIFMGNGYNLTIN